MILPDHFKRTPKDDWYVEQRKLLAEIARIERTMRFVKIAFYLFIAGCGVAVLLVAYRMAVQSFGIGGLL